MGRKGGEPTGHDNPTKLCIVEKGREMLRLHSCFYLDASSHEKQQGRNWGAHNPIGPPNYRSIGNKEVQRY